LLTSIQCQPKKGTLHFDRQRFWRHFDIKTRRIAQASGVTRLGAPTGTIMRFNGAFSSVALPRCSSGLPRSGWHFSSKHDRKTSY